MTTLTQAETATYRTQEIALAQANDAARRDAALSLRQATERRRASLAECDRGIVMAMAKLKAARDRIARALAPSDAVDETGPPGMTAGFGTGARFPLEELCSDAHFGSNAAPEAVAAKLCIPRSATSDDSTDPGSPQENDDSVLIAEALRKLGVTVP
jgi:hypothetical protein